MARIRTIKPEFPQSESIGRLSRDARLLFILLWTVADDEGRCRAASRMLASLLYPYDQDAGSLMDGWIEELERENCLDRYSASGNTFIQIRNWLNHQKIDKPSPSKIPPFDESSRILANPRERSSGDLRIKEGIKDQGRDQGPPMSALPTAVESVFRHWQQVHNHPQAKLDAKRRRVIAKALKSYTEADLCQAISGYLNSPHHMGQNDRATRYDSIELFLRDAQHIDAGLRFHAEPPRTDLSALSRKNVAAIEDWTPPEVRNGTR